MSKTFEKTIMFIGYLMIGSFVILILNWSDRGGQIWFLCLSVYIPFYVYYAEKKRRILSLTESSLDLNFRDNPNFFRFHQVVYIIFAISTFVIIVSQLTEG